MTLAIGTNPGGGTLAGTKTKAAVAGVATFSDLSINKIGRGYTLTATSAGLTSATSVVFDIRAGTATKLIVETAPDGTGAAVSAQSLAAGSTLKAWAITRDANNNYRGERRAGQLVADGHHRRSRDGRPRAAVRASRNSRLQSTALPGRSRPAWGTDSGSAR